MPFASNRHKKLNIIIQVAVTKILKGLEDIRIQKALYTAALNPAEVDKLDAGRIMVVKDPGQTLSRMPSNYEVTTPKDMEKHQLKTRPSMLISIAEKIEDPEEYRLCLEKAYVNGSTVIAFDRLFDGWLTSVVTESNSPLHDIQCRGDLRILTDSETAKSRLLDWSWSQDRCSAPQTYENI